MINTHPAVPRFLTIMEVAQILKISSRLVEERCASNTFKSYRNEETGVLYVLSDTFQKNALMWAQFLEKRNEWLAVSAAVAHIASKPSAENAG